MLKYFILSSRLLKSSQMKLLFFFFFFGLKPDEGKAMVEEVKKKRQWFFMVGIATMFVCSIITGGTFYTLNYFIPKKGQCCNDTVNVKIVDKHSYIDDIGKEAMKIGEAKIIEKLFSSSPDSNVKISTSKNQDSSSLKTKNKLKIYTK